MFRRHIRSTCSCPAHPFPVQMRYGGMKWHYVRQERMAGLGGRRPWCCDRRGALTVHRIWMAFLAGSYRGCRVRPTFPSHRAWPPSPSVPYLPQDATPPLGYASKGVSTSELLFASR